MKEHLHCRELNLETRLAEILLGFVHQEWFSSGPI